MAKRIIEARGAHGYPMSAVQIQDLLREIEDRDPELYAQGPGRFSRSVDDAGGPSMPPIASGGQSSHFQPWNYDSREQPPL